MSTESLIVGILELLIYAGKIVGGMLVFDKMKPHLANKGFKN